jgi:ribosomal protein S8
MSVMYLFGTRCSGITLTISNGEVKDIVTLDYGSYSDIKVELNKEPTNKFLVVSYINAVNKIERQEYYNIDRIERIDASLEL